MQTPTVHIKWSDIFNASYVRKVISVKKHSELDMDGIPFGHISQSNYLPKSVYANSQAYNDGEIFIICESDWFNGVLSGASIPYFYSLVIVNSKSPKGCDVIDIVEHHIGYPWHENKIVASMIRNKIFEYQGEK
jgi:hypothetical protein